MSFTLCDCEFRVDQVVMKFFQVSLVEAEPGDLQWPSVS